MEGLEDQIDFIQSLPEDVKNSILWYTGGNYYIFNDALRKNGKVPEKYRKYFDDLNSAFRNAPPLDTSITVYKGKKSETVFSDKAFVSTSLDYKGTLDFQGSSLDNVSCCVLQITVSAGSKVLPILSLSINPHEQEILLDRDGEMYVTGSTIRNGEMKVIFVTYTPKKSISVHEEKSLRKAEKSMDSDLIVERVIKFFQDSDQEDSDQEDLVSDQEISLMYKKITNKNISAYLNLCKIKDQP